MTDQQKDAIAHVTITNVFPKKGMWVVSEGDIATSYYIIKKGAVMAVKGDKDVRRMVLKSSYLNHYFFQKQLIKN
jgi:cGMP-dependent protein kinase